MNRESATRIEDQMTARSCPAARSVDRCDQLPAPSLASRFIHFTSTISVILPSLIQWSILFYDLQPVQSIVPAISIVRTIHGPLTMSTTSPSILSTTSIFSSTQTFCSTSTPLILVSLRSGTSHTATTSPDAFLSALISKSKPPQFAFRWVGRIRVSDDEALSGAIVRGYATVIDSIESEESRNWAGNQFPESDFSSTVE